MKTRKDEIQELYRSGLSQSAIGDMYGITKQRVSQILKQSPRKRKTEAERFWAKVEKGGENDCWIWMANVSRAGYGLFAGTSAHRTAWRLTNGEIPDGVLVCHKCDNRKCVNPNHLFLGSYSDNNQDTWNKGRHPRAGRPVTKFTAEAIEEIVRLKASGMTYGEIAKVFNSSSEYVSFVVKRRTT